MLASQLPIVEARTYDFMQIREMTTATLSGGVMWRFGEQFELPTAARERGFICLMSMLVGDGMGARDVNVASLT